MNTVLLLLRLVLAAVFAVAGIAKLRDRTGASKAARDFGVPAALAGPVSLLLSVAEVLCAVALVPVQTAWWGAAGLLLLLIVFTVAMAVALARGRAVDCRCFGQLSSTPIGPATLVRNLVLATMAAVLVARGAEGAGPSVASAAATLDGVQMLNLALAAVIVFGVFVLVHVLRQYGRLLLRVEALESGAGGNQVAAPPPVGLPVGSPVPAVSLTALDGQTATLQTLGASGHPVLLVFVTPACGACDALLPDMATWQRDYDDRLTVALVSQGAAKTRTKVAGHGIRTVLVEDGHTATDAFQVPATPSAVLIREGRVASPVSSGPDAIRALVAEATMPPPVKRGDVLPRLKVRALDGEPFDLLTLRGRALLLFWNPGCGFCQQMLDGVRRWEEVSGGGRLNLVVVSAGSVSDIQQQGFASPVILDEGSVVSRVFGANGTPSAVLIRDGRVASDVAMGAVDVWKLAGVKQAVPA